MANIKVSIDYPISDGTKLKFRTPCESTEVEGLVVKYPVKDGIGSATKTFRFVDAHGTELSGIGNVFTSDVMIELILDVTKGRAFIQNADTNSYIENIKLTVKRMDEERQKIFADAGKSITECNKATKDANEAANTLKLSAEEVRSGGFVESLKELNEGKKFTIWVGTYEEYNQITKKKPDCLYIITDESNADILGKIEYLTNKISDNKEETDHYIELLNDKTSAHTILITNLNDLVEGITIYEGEAASTVTVPDIDYRSFTRFIAETKMTLEDNGITHEYVETINFNFVKSRSAGESGKEEKVFRTLVAYATITIPTEDVDIIITYRMEIVKDHNTARFTVSQLDANGLVKGEALHVNKLVGYTY